MAYKASSDRLLFIVTSLLTIFGLVMVYSASSVVASTKYGISYYYFFRQFAYGALGFLLMVLLLNLDYHFWQREKVVKLLFILRAARLRLVVGPSSVNGARGCVE